MAAFVVGAVALVGFGTGYRATRSLTNDDSAWLRKGDTIVHINGPSARYDAVVSDQPTPVADSASDPLEVAQEPNGHVYTADPVTHRVYEIDLDSMTPIPGPNGTSVLASGQVAYIVNRAESNPRLGRSPHHGAGRDHPDSGSDHGPDHRLRWDGLRGPGRRLADDRRRQQGPHCAGRARRSSLQVTEVGAQPVAVDVTEGRLYPLTSRRSSHLQHHRPRRPRSAGRGPARTARPGRWLVRGSQLMGIDLANDQAQAVSLPSGHSFGAPVVNAGRVFVPDDTAGQVLEFDATNLAALPPIAVPAGAPAVHDIEAFAKDGEVWIDNPSSQDAAVVSSSGAVTTIDKGTGNQVVNPLAHPRRQPPASGFGRGARGRPPNHRVQGRPARSAERPARPGPPGPHGAQPSTGGSTERAPGSPPPRRASDRARPPPPPLAATAPPPIPPPTTSTTQPTRRHPVAPTTTTTRLVPVPAPGANESPAPTAPG